MSSNNLVLSLIIDSIVKIHSSPDKNKQLYCENTTPEQLSNKENNDISQEAISKNIDIPILATKNTLEIPAIQNAFEEGCNAIIQQLPGKNSEW